MSQESVFLEVKDLVVEYTSNKKIVQAVNGISFSLEKGKTLGLVGETGAGKTTVAKAILRILPTPPARVKSGSVLLDGTDLMKLPESSMRKIRGNDISMIFQDPMTALDPLMTVGAQICEAIQLHNENIDLHTAVEKSIEMLETVGIPGERYGEYPHQFSGGMKQRIAIAIALACNPLLLLADEPTTALDVTIQAQVLELIKELQQKYQTSMILITHDLGVVAETCDDVAVVYAGEIVEYGSKSEIYKNTAHPYTQGLFESLPNAGNARLKPIDGMPPDPTDLPKGCKFSPRCPMATEECKAHPVEMREIASGHFCRCNLVGKEV
jgi:peptide/nickel transport system ATP-binding protein